MSFLAPLFLLALGALAVPVLLHLIQRERKDVVQFPSLMFIRRIPYQSIRRRRIRHWLLLLVRVGALLLIVTAFARPFIQRSELAAAASSGPRELVILLDRSYSMGYGDRWERARAEARRAADGLGPQDRASLVLFSTAAEATVRASREPGALRAAIDSARVGSGATRYGPALKLAQSILAESTLPRREAVLVTDFQQIGWRSEDAVRFPEGTVFTPVPIGGGETTRNVTVTAVSFQRAAFSGQERVTISAGLANRGDRAVSGREVRLEIDGRTVQTERVSVEPGLSASVTFAPVTLTAVHTRGTVRAAADALPQDDAFHFVIAPGEPVPVLLLERAAAARDASLYLTRALAIGDSPTFSVERLRSDQAGAADLDRFRAAGGSSAARAPRAAGALAIVNDAPVSSALARALEKFVAQGGGLLVVLGERAAWPSNASTLLPGTLGPPIDRASGRGGWLGVIDYSHPVFEIFKAPRSGDFSPARFYRYRTLDIPGASSGAAAAGEPPRILARFDDGAVALVERKLGLGRVMVWTSTLDNVWNDLAVRPVFLPFSHRIARHLAGYVEPSPWLTVGQVFDPRGVPGLRAGDKVSREWVVLTPSGQRLSPASSGSGLVELGEQGFYELRARSAEQRPYTIAANLDVSESDLTPLDPQELGASVSGRALTGGSGDQVIEVGPIEQERRQRFWWYLLLAGLLLLAAETTISNRLSRAAR